MIIRRSFRYRIYPTPEQEARLTAWEHSLRWLWNIAHEQRLMAHERRCKVDAKYPTAFDQINELTRLRADLPWLADVPRDVTSQLIVELDRAWQRCFARISLAPDWKRKDRDSVSLCMSHSKKFTVVEDAIRFTRLGMIRAVIHRPLVGKQKMCSLVRDGDAWFANVTCEIEIADPAPSTKPAVAIDRGVVNLIADSNGRVVPNQRAFEKLQDRIVRAQRVRAKKKKGSKNQTKARVRVARLLRKARWQRDAVLHRESLHYAKNHGTVIVERLNLRGMTKSAKGSVEEPGTNVAQKAGLNRSLRNAAPGRFVLFLLYKVIRYGGTVVEVQAAYSSQECSVCHHVAAENRSSQSVFECVSCGHRENADVNAAKVLLSRGTRGGAVCGGVAARGRPTKQKLRVVRRGTHSSEPKTQVEAFKHG